MCAHYPLDKDLEDLIAALSEKIWVQNIMTDQIYVFGANLVI